MKRGSLFLLPSLNKFPLLRLAQLTWLQRNSLENSSSPEAFVEQIFRPNENFIVNFYHLPLQIFQRTGIRAYASLTRRLNRSDKTKIRHDKYLPFNFSIAFFIFEQVAEQRNLQNTPWQLEDFPQNRENIPNNREDEPSPFSLDSFFSLANSLNPLFNFMPAR